MIHYETAAILCIIAFAFGIVGAILLKDRRILNLCAKLATTATRLDELTSESFDLRRQLHDVKFLLEMRNAECTKLRDRLRGEIRIVRGDGPKGAA
jgi:hypothetical protein